MRKATSILVSMILLACSEGDDRIILAEPGTLVVYIDGELSESVSIKATSASQFNSELHISAKFVESDTTRIDFSIGTNNIYLSLAPDSYIIKGKNPAVPIPAFFYLPDDGQGIFSSQYFPEPIAGTIVVTEFDSINKLISGTFEVKLVRNTQTINLTNGSFNQITFGY